MNDKTITLVSVVLLLMSAAVIVAADASDASENKDGTNSSTGTDSVATVSGNCGTGGAGWVFDIEGKTLSITASGTSTTVNDGFNPTGTSWNAWGNPTYRDANDKTVTESMTPSQVFGSNAITLTISGNVSIDAGAFKDFNIASITLSGCTSISSGAFQGCANVTSVFLDAVATIGDNAFNGCAKLTTVNGGTSLTSIGKGAFQDCAALTTIDIHKAQVEHDAFKGCSKLTSIKASDSTHYTVSTNGIVYSDGGSTVYMAPTGLKPTAPIVLDDKVTKVFLDFADVTYIADICRTGGATVTYEKVSETDSNAKCVLYSSLGMKDPKVSVSGSNFVLTYGELYNGWTVDLDTISLSQGTPSLDAGAGTITFQMSDGNGYTLLPMGVAVMSLGDLERVTSINGWKVGDIRIQGMEDGGVLTDITQFSGNVIGYEENGPTETTLGQTLVYRGAEFRVTLLRPEPGSMNSIEHLTIDGDLQFSEGTFANCMNLKRVDMDEVKEIPAQAFRYCTALEYVSLESCTEVGDYAFEGCTLLTGVVFHSASVALGDDAFNNCTSLEYILAKMDTAVSGDAGVPILHVSDNASGNIEVTDNYILVDTQGFASIAYTYSNGGESATANVYSGGAAAIPLNGSGEVYLTLNAGTPSSDCLVVFDAILDLSVPSQVVKAGSTLSSIPAPSVDGYTFMGWIDASGEQLTEDTKIESSTLYTAQWQKENSSSNTPVYVLAIFAVAIVATVAVLFVNSRR